MKKKRKHMRRNHLKAISIIALRMAWRILDDRDKGIIKNELVERLIGKLKDYLSIGHGHTYKCGRSDSTYIFEEWRECDVIDFAYYIIDSMAVSFECYPPKADGGMRYAWV